MTTASDLLVVQNDTGDAVGANAYCDVDFFKTYCISRGKSLVKTAAADPANNVLYSDDEIAAAIMGSREYMDGRWGSKYVGQRMQELQDTEWPRYDAYDNSDFYINGVTDILRKANAEYAYILLTTTDLNPNPTRDETGQRVQRKTTQVGPILDSVTYVTGAAFDQPTYPTADNILRSRGYILSGSSLIRA